MKNTLHIIIAVLFLVSSIASCCKEKEPTSCSAFSEEFEQEYVCSLPDSVSEIFLVLEDMPSYGVNESDLADYFFSNLEICGLAEIKEGEIALQILVNALGEPCLNKIKGKAVFKDSVVGIDSLVNNMGNWQPGLQRGNPVHVKFWIKIIIENGVIISIVQ